MLDPQLIKKDFPILNRTIDGKPIVYLDNAATTQKPQRVIDALSTFYSEFNSTVSRSSHFLAEEATNLYEGARKNVASFIHADPAELIFTKNATESLNMVAFGWGMHNLPKNSVILTTQAEHNSSILPWQAVAKALDCKIDYFDLDDAGMLSPNWKDRITTGVKVILITHVSNVLGTVLPIKQIAQKAKEVGAVVIVDGSQAVSHLEVNVKDLDCDFYAFSGHKMMGPMGIGVLYGKRAVLEKMLPISFGGGITKEFSIDKKDLQDIPYCFEAGTPSVADAIGLSTAVDYIKELGLENMHAHVKKLTVYTLEKLSAIEDLVIVGPKNAEDRLGVVSFYITGTHSHDIGSILSQEGIAVRSGLHCAMNLYKSLDIPSTTRISLYAYNTTDDIDRLYDAIIKAKGILK